jgi:hypothetical protein
MSDSRNPLRAGSLDEEKWTLVRDFEENEAGHALPRYEAKAVTGVSKRFVEDDVVLLRETSSIGPDHGRTFLLPREVVEETARRLR